MSVDPIPCLTIALARMEAVAVDRFAIWVTRAPLPAGYVHRDCRWTDDLTALWMMWQEMYGPRDNVPPWMEGASAIDPVIFPEGEGSYGGQLMQSFGIGLWRWLFQEAIGGSLARSEGIAMGMNQPLRVRLDIRDPFLTLLPWEIMQVEAGRPAIGLCPQILFSRSTCDVDPLVPTKPGNSLEILLVQGVELPGAASLQLEEEAARIIQKIEAEKRPSSPVRLKVDLLNEPSAEELTRTLDTGRYNAFFYAGHGLAAPNGGTLFLRHDERLNGTELAGALVRNRVSLAVFNACWGAYPARSGPGWLERSSLAEVSIHHGVPAVLAMRDAIADREALSFIENFTRALARRQPIDHAVRFARAQLLTLYKYNQPAWTLPILYMHPEFDGRLLHPDGDGITRLPDRNSPPDDREGSLLVYLRDVERPDRLWKVHGGLMRVGRHPENDLILSEQWVSQRHGEIICRRAGDNGTYQYFLRDFSRFGTFIARDEVWHQVHHQETRLQPGSRVRFGSHEGLTLEFVVESRRNF